MRSEKKNTLVKCVFVCMYVSVRMPKNRRLLVVLRVCGVRRRIRLLGVCLCFFKYISVCFVYVCDASVLPTYVYVCTCSVSISPQTSNARFN